MTDYSAQIDQIADQADKPADYGALIDKMTTDQATANLINGSDIPPDRAARALDLSHKTGIPLPAIQQNLDEYEKQTQLGDNRATLAQSPATAAWVANNPGAAPAAANDIQNLSGIEGVLSAIKSGYNMANMESELNRIEVGKQAGAAVGVETPETNQRIGQMKQAIAGQPQFTGPLKAVQTLTSGIVGMLDSAPSIIAGTVSGALVGGPVGAAVGAGFAFRADQAVKASGQTYEALSDVRGANGETIGEPAKQGASVLAGVANFFFLKIGGSEVADAIQGVTEQAAKELVTKPAFNQAVAQYAKAVPTAGAKMAVLNGAMEGSNIMLEQLAKSVTPGDFETDPDEIKDRLVDAMLNGFVFGAFVHGSTGAMGLYGDFRQAQMAEQHAQLFQNLLDGSEKSNLRNGSLGTFQDFLQSQTDGTPIENLHIPAEKIREFYQSAGVDPNLADRTQDPLFGFVKDMPNQLREAQATNGDVVIPTADYVAHLAGSPISEKLMPDIRVGADSMSLNEAKEYQAAYEKNLKDAQAQTENQEPDAHQQIIADISQKARDAGYTASTASQYGAILAARHMTRAERLGVDPMELYKKEAPDIQAATVQEGNIPAKTFTQHGIDDTPDNRQKLSDIAHAATIDENAVKEAAKAHPDDEDAFHKAIQEINNGQEQSKFITGSRAATGEGSKRFSQPDETPGSAGYTGADGKTTGSPADRSNVKYNQSANPTDRWYSSKLNDAIEGLPVKVRTGNDAAIWLQANGAKLGIKKEEIEWSGVTDWLKLKGKEPVSKDEIRDFLDNNGIKVEDRFLGQQDAVEALAKDFQKEGYDIQYGHEDEGMIYLDPEGDPVEYDDLPEDLQRVVDEASNKFSAPKFASYQLPGGENYRELLITLPGNRDRLLAERTDIEQRGGLLGGHPDVEANRKRVEEINDSLVSNPAFHSPHFSEQNILAHIRMNDRIDADGKKVLFVEELQSDWGQQGKKEGFAGKSETYKVSQAKDGTWFAADSGGDGEGGFATQREAQAWADTENKRSPHVVPSAPFVTDTKAWTALALKRVIAYAADHDYDKVAWTNGEQQAARYDLSEQVNRIEVSRGQDGSFALYLYKDKGDTVPIHQTRVESENDLHDQVGKDLAEKIAKQPIGTKRDYTGLDLKVGGEGMKGYYDQIVPQVANEVLRKLGGGKVGDVLIGRKPEFTLRTGRVDVILSDGSTHSFASIEHAKEYAEKFGDVPASQPGFDITPELRKSVDQGLPLFQDSNNGAVRGSVRFQDGRALISLFNSADTSTLIHESSHVWLEEMIRDAAREDAPEQVKNDLQTILKYLGVESPDQISVAQHEQFARTGEAYLMEGKAPSAALAGAFSRFKAWLTKLYQTVSGLNVPINDEIRGVFDRLLATDAEIEDARKTSGLEPNFKTKEDAGMTSAEWKSYLNTFERANQIAESKMLEKTMAQVRRKRTAEYRAEADTVRDEATKAVDARPDVEALNLLQKGQYPERLKSENPEDQPAIKLDRKTVEQMVGKKGATDLPKGVMAAKGEHPDGVAEMLGYADGRALIDALTALEQQQRELRLQEGEKRTIRQSLIDQEIEKRIGNNDAMDEASIRDEAMAAIHSTKREEMLGMELRYLNRAAAKALEGTGKVRKAGEEKLSAAEQKLADERMSSRWTDAERNTVRDKLKAAVSNSKAMLDVMREQARYTVEAKSVDEIGRFSKYLRDERKAAREVQQAILKGDPQAAAEAKQRQMMSAMMYKAARDAADNIKSAEANFKRLAGKPSFKGMDQAFTDQIHGLLERFGIDTKRDPEELNRALNGEDLVSFINGKFGQGYELPITRFLATGGGDIGNLRYSDFKDLDDLVRSLQSAGRESQSVRVGSQVIEKEEAVTEMVGALSQLSQREKTNYLKPEDAALLERKKEAFLSAMRSTNAALLKKEQLFDWMDGDNIDGPFNRMVFRPLKEAQHWEDQRRFDMVKAYKEIQDRLPDGWSKHLDEPVDANLINRETGDPYKLTRKRMLSIALNWGTEDNATKLLNGYGWNDRTVQDILDRNMKPEDWEFVKSVWGLFESLRPEIDELQRRVTGVGIEFVEGRSIHTPDGNIEGKYFPLVYDASKSITAEKNLERSSESLFENQYTRATTRNGSTISRVQGVKMPVDLSLDIVPTKLMQTIHDLAFREAIMNADKLLSDRRVIKAMDDSLGPEYRKLMRPWLQHLANVANVNDAALAFTDRFLNQLRTNVVMVGIGFRISTFLKHSTTALSNSVGELGPKYMAIGLKEAMGTPQQMRRAWHMAFEMSDELKFRRDQYDRDLTANMGSLTGDENLGTLAKQKLQEYGHWAVANGDMMSAVPTWFGAFRKGQDQGLSDKDAAYYADKTVRNAHGAQGLVDKAAFQDSKSQLFKMTGMFYGFFNHIYNRQMATVRLAGDATAKVRSGDFKGATNDFGQVLARTIYYLVIPALAEAYWSGKGPDQDNGEGWFGWGAKAIAAEVPAGVPIMRDIAKAAIEGRDYEVSPMARAINTAIGTAKDIGVLTGIRDAEPSKKMPQHFMETLGYFTGLPTGQAAATAQFLWNVEQGDESPASISEWFDGIMHGKVTK